MPSDSMHYPSIPTPTDDMASMRRTVMAMKEVIELMAGTRGNPASDPLRMPTALSLRATPFRLATFAPTALPAADMHPNSVVLVQSPSGTKLLISDGVAWREAQGVQYSP